MLPLREVMKVAVAGSLTMTAREAEAFDRLLDVIAEEVVERYFAELEAAEADEPECNRRRPS